LTTSVPARDTLEDSQFDQAVALRQLGVQIPDAVLIDASRLMNRKEIIQQVMGDQNSPDAQMKRELEKRGHAAEVSKLEGEAAQKHADAGLKQAKTQATAIETQIAAQGEPDDGSAQAKMYEAQIKHQQAERDAALKQAQAARDADLKERQFQQSSQLQYAEMGMKREQMDMDMQLKAADMAQKRDMQRVEQARQAAAAAQAPRNAAQGAPE
jgi:hypothetical protein